MVRLRGLGRRLRTWFVHLLHLDDSAARIAMGAAVGVFVAFTPTMGVQIILVLLLLTFIPGNRAAGLPTVFITNPATAVPIYYFNYRVGAWVLGHTKLLDTRGQWSQLLRTVPKLSTLLEAPMTWFSQTWTWLGHFWKAMEGVMAPLWVGSLIVSLVCGVTAYVAMYYLISLYRARLRDRLYRLAALRQLRARRHAAHKSKSAGPSRNEGDSPPDGPFS